MIFTSPDFPNGFDADQLRQALLKAHGSHFNVATASHEVVLDDGMIGEVGVEREAVMQTCLEHFDIDWNKRHEVDAQITAIERANEITPRALREFMLNTLAFAHADVNANPVFKRAAEMDAEIQQLRRGRP